MDCQAAREQILDSLLETGTSPATPGVEAHIEGCQDCQGFHRTQSLLDLQIGAALAAPRLSPAFRRSLREKLRGEPGAVWRDYLPDVAHVTGCLFVTALCLVAGPFHAGPVMLAGLAFTAGTYLIQAALQGSLEAWDLEQSDLP